MRKCRIKMVVEKEVDLDFYGTEDWLKEYIMEGTCTVMADQQELMDDVEITSVIIKQQ